jgi:hypothetical protein
MPRVPSSKLQQISPSPLNPGYQSGRGSEDGRAFGRGQGVQKVADGLGSAGDAVNRVLLAREQELAELKVVAADIEYTNRVRMLLHGDGTDENRGYFSLQGKAALDASGTTAEELKKIRADVIEKGEHNTAVRKRLSAMLSSRQAGHEQNIVTFQQRQRDDYANTLAEARMSEAVQDSIAAYNDPAAVRRGLAIINDSVTLMAERGGWAPEVVSLKRSEAAAVLHTGIIERLLSVEDVAGATSYFRSNLDQIDPRLHASIQRKLDSAREQISNELLARASSNRAFISAFGRLPGSYAADQAALDALPGERGQKAAAEHRQLGEVLGEVQEFQGLTLADQAALVRQMYESADSPEELPLFQALSQSLDTTAKALRDGTVLELYQQRGEINLAPLGNYEPATLQEREATSKMLSEHLGVPVSPLTKGEVDALVQQIEDAPSGQIAAVFAATTNGFSEKAIGAITQQIVGKKPAYAAALHLSRHNPVLASDIIRGERLLRENSDLRPTPTQLREVSGSSGLNEALILSPEARAAYLAAASALYVERTTSGQIAIVPGVLWGTNEHEYELGHAVQEVTGMIEFNRQPIIPPAGISERQFEDMVGNLTDEHLDERGNGSVRITRDFTADTIRDGDATFVTVSPGIYQVLIPGLGYVSVKDYVTGEIVAYQIDLNGFNPPTREVPRTTDQERLEQMREPLAPNTLFGRE